MYPEKLTLFSAAVMARKNSLNYLVPSSNIFSIIFEFVSQKDNLLSFHERIYGISESPNYESILPFSGFHCILNILS